MPNPVATGGGNPGGFNAPQVAPVPGGGNGTMGSISGNNNPMLAPFPQGQSAPGLASPYSFPANSSGNAIPNIPMNAATGQAQLGKGYNPGDLSKIVRAFTDSGVPSGLAQLMASFMASGSGYSPQVLQSLFAQLQPQINRGEADIMEHFGSQGMGMSSPASIGMGDFLSQVNLNEGQMASQLYEQSINNYMQVLLGGSKYQSQDAPGFWTGLGEQLAGTAAKAGVAGLGSMAGGGSFMGGVSSSMGGAQ